MGYRAEGEVMLGIEYNRRLLVVWLKPLGSYTFHHSPHTHRGSHGNWCVATCIQVSSILPLKLTSSDGNRMRLNNLLQSRKTLQLTWQTTQTGPAHQPVWQAVAFSAFLVACAYENVLMGCTSQQRGIRQRDRPDTGSGERSCSKRSLCQDREPISVTA